LFGSFVTVVQADGTKKDDNRIINEYGLQRRATASIQRMEKVYIVWIGLESGLS